jgi:hypothetical protein
MSSATRTLIVGHVIIVSVRYLHGEPEPSTGYRSGPHLPAEAGDPVGDPAEPGTRRPLVLVSTDAVVLDAQPE